MLEKSLNVLEFHFAVSVLTQSVADWFDSWLTTFFKKNEWENMISEAVAEVDGRYRTLCALQNLKSFHRELLFPHRLAWQTPH